MKNTDLRMGNQILIAYAGAEGKEWRSYPAKIEDLIDIHLNSNNYKPIALTKTILIELGFEDYINDEGYEMFRIDDFEIEFMHLIEKDFYFRSNLREETKLKYVHQLQNLYYSLTGEELTL